MKKIEDLNNKEIISLTDEQIEDLIKIQLAEDGIKIPIKPLEPKLTVVPPPDKTVYQIGSFDIYFEDKSVVDKIQSIMSDNFSSMKELQYSSNVGYDIKYISPLCDNYIYRDGFTISSKKVYSKELFHQLKISLQNNNQIKEDYDKLKKEYEENIEKTQNTRAKILNKIKEVKNAEQEKNNKLNIFREYLELSDGDKQTAWKFMKKVYDVTEDEEKYINENIKNHKNDMEKLSNFIQS